MNDKELIAEIRDGHARQDRREGEPPMCLACSPVDWPCDAVRAADALEARLPSVIDRDTAIDAIAGGTISVPGGYGVLHGDDAASIVDAIIGQAAVPDTPPEGQVIIPIARIHELRAAKDAALEAIERVRAINTGNNRALYGNDFEAGMAKALWLVKTALDGAPEPDNDDPCDAEVYSWDHYRPEQIDSYWIRCTLLDKHDEHEDSHTGLKWRSGLPVEGGES